MQQLPSTALPAVFSTLSKSTTQRKISLYGSLNRRVQALRLLYEAVTISVDLQVATYYELLTERLLTVC